MMEAQMSTTMLYRQTRARGGSGFVAKAGRGFWQTLRVWFRNAQTRRGLAEMDDRMLKDLGISRAQADFELSRLPWHTGVLPELSAHRRAR
jgi:uncharacterized protein YjiS (DUF1127 family)